MGARWLCRFLVLREYHEIVLKPVRIRFSVGEIVEEIAEDISLTDFPLGKSRGEANFRPGKSLRKIKSEEEIGSLGSETVAESGRE